MGRKTTGYFQQQTWVIALEMTWKQLKEGNLKRETVLIAAKVKSFDSVVSKQKLIIRRIAGVYDMLTEMNGLIL